MKKVYTAPQILFESFTMSTNIAAGCDSIVGNPSKGSCAVLGSAGEKFFSGTMVDICDFNVEEFGQAPDMWDGFCYHVPNENSDLFNS